MKYNNLKELLNDKGVTGYRLSKDTDIAMMTINDIINENKLDKTSVKNGIAIAKALDMSVEELYKSIY